MPYPANIINVLIACPSDVMDEKDAIRRTIDDWNIVHGPDTKLIALPMNWETHVAPQMGGPPQTIINKELVEKCDVLVAIFRTRIGTPTSEAEGGTIEEIQKHTKAKRPAMVYFSKGQANLDEIDTAQLDALRKFQDKMGDHGVLCEYKSLQEFCDKFKNHLAQTILREYGNLRVSAAPPTAEQNPLADLEESMPDVLEDLRKVLREHPNIRDILWIRTKGIAYNWPGPHVTFSEDVDPGIRDKLNVLANHGLLRARDSNDDFAYKMTEEFVRMLRKGQPQMPPETKLSEDARELLIAGATDNAGRINILKTLSSRVVHVGNRRFGDSKSASDFARWTKAVKDLEEAGFIEPQNADGLFAVTHEGYEVAKRMSQLQQNSPTDTTIKT